MHNASTITDTQSPTLTSSIPRSCLQARSCASLLIYKQAVPVCMSVHLLPSPLSLVSAVSSLILVAHSSFTLFLSYLYLRTFISSVFLK
ncbi:hypothetical protein BT96DRAFT_630300 [Gymnopus androsaceus JB14]|uniref:Uncharacterized protein n=1 Tax=Gymnopus androsaceus JB14 TaxID=1447944 RepID=A0A6A4IIL2_9AGAR|nr:hypothetical protein BT96DRAFT_630300 [Gymnopus androsaceus JB14]